MHLSKKFVQYPIITIIFLILVPTIFHLLFSSLGFNPTDDGFTLAYGRRIIEGQIPHRDFISIRPFLSPFIHLPFVLWGGDYTYWISRYFVWFQLACIAWIGVSIIERLLKQSFGPVEKTLIALISFSASTHTFPIMAWHTVDGLFLLSIGLVLCVTQRANNKLIGYFLMGMAYLCKQGFLFMAPFTLIVLGDWRRTKYWLIILIPGILYVIFLLFSNAFPDALIQLTSQTGLLSVGLKNYFNREMLLGFLIGYFSIPSVIGSPKIKLLLDQDLIERFGLLMLSLMPIVGIVITFILGKGIFHLSFVLFGLVLGITCYFLIEKTENSVDQASAGLLVLMLAWSASLSLGYNFPVLVSGQLLALLLSCTYSKIIQRIGKKTYIVSLIICAFGILISFGWARVNYIYREQSTPNLTMTLDGILPGGKRILTNANTYAFLVDLQSAIEIATDLGKTYSIIPDCAGYWVKSSQINPLPIDWPQGTELNRQALIDRVIQRLESIRDTNIVIVQKVEASTLAKEFLPLGRYAIVEYVLHHFTKTYETTLFELYE